MPTFGARWLMLAHEQTRRIGGNGQIRESPTWEERTVDRGGGCLPRNASARGAGFTHGWAWWVAPDSKVGPISTVARGRWWCRLIAWQPIRWSDGPEPWLVIVVDGVRTVIQVWKEPIESAAASRTLPECAATGCDWNGDGALQGTDKRTARRTMHLSRPAESGRVTKSTWEASVGAIYQRGSAGPLNASVRRAPIDVGAPVPPIETVALARCVKRQRENVHA